MLHLEKRDITFLSQVTCIVQWKGNYVSVFAAVCVWNLEHTGDSLLIILTVHAGWGSWNTEQ